ncbi:MAG: 5-oxoprolinase subunit PxpB [Bacteroidota bacterium]
MKLNYQDIKFSYFNEQAILLEFKPEINSEQLFKILDLKEFLEKECAKDSLEIRNTYHSLLIQFFDFPLAIDEKIAEVKKLVKSWFNENNSIKNSKKKSQLHTLPVCYEPEFGLDLEFLAKEKKCSVQEIVDLHTQIPYLIYFLGFIPGFLYLGGLDEKLFHSRKATPRPKVAAGSVGIGEQQTGIYPSESPGGWQLLGDCPVPLFEAENNPPSQFLAGDFIQFESVDLETYQSIQAAIEKGKYTIKTTDYEF